VLHDFQHKRIKMVLGAFLVPLLDPYWEPLGRCFGACWAFWVALGLPGAAKTFILGADKRPKSE